MPIDQTVLTSSLGINLVWIWGVTKLLLLLLVFCYFLFSLVVVRQVTLMTETLMTESAPVLRAMSIIHAGFALGVIILFIGILFGN